MGAASVAGDLLELARYIAGRPEYPEAASLEELTDAAILSLSSDPPCLRPSSSSGEPGGLVRVAAPYAVIVPDLHARASLLADLLGSVSPIDPRSLIVDMILDGRLALVCLGDILNSEGAAGAERWGSVALRLGSSQGLNGLLGPEMDEEMGASLGALCLVMALKVRLGGRFHCLKGNHDNISNSSRDGDLAFYKYALEGAMGAEWFRLRYGEALMRSLRRYERLLPLVAAGNSFCASHAEPAFPLSRVDLLEYGKRPEVVGALIWTGNGEAAENAVKESLDALLGSPGAEDRALWISGHRPVSGAYALRAGGRLVQIHDPNRRQVAWIDNRAGGASGVLSLHEVAQGGGALTLLEVADPFHLDHSASRH
ncbi:MAG TPA: hypothetical protein VN445_14750 [Rectinemataceae bacterium]|nr:hypothetical protein [Rectinemataceae bacterium]